MDPAWQEPDFKPLLCPNRLHKQSERPFSPIAHDLIVLSPETGLRIAENAPATQIISYLIRSNRKCASIHNGGMDDIAPLIAIRFEEDDPSRNAQPESHDDWSQLWPYFDSCCNNEDTAVDFVTRLRQADAHCYSSTSKNTVPCGNHQIECTKISYNANFPDNHILIAHHFHKLDGEVKQMIRIVTYGIYLEKIEATLCKALKFLDLRSSEPDSGSPDVLAPPILVPHPKAIMCGMLDHLEEVWRKKIKENGDQVKIIEDDIREQRDPNTRKDKGLEINYVKLGDTSIRLGEVRQKLQCFLSSIASLEDMDGLPSDCKTLSSIGDKQSITDRSLNTSEGRYCHQWGRQLREVGFRLKGLKGICEQHNIEVDNLQERVKGILSIVSILLAEKENEWSHQALSEQQETSKYQTRIIKYQADMLEQQELIASRTKRDNTVMKVIAVLTSLFLPGTFIATVFSVPVFNWGNEDPRGPHFMTYWYFTAPITTFLVIGFSIWFVRMWYDDRQEENLRARQKSQDDPERVNRGKRESLSMNS